MFEEALMLVGMSLFLISEVTELLVVDWALPFNLLCLPV